MNDESSLESKTRDKKTKDFIDTVISTLYARGARGYSTSPKVLENTAVNLIEREIEKVDKSKRKKLKDETEYRIERFKELMEGSEETRAKIRKLARDKHVSFEQATEMLLEDKT